MAVQGMAIIINIGCERFLTQIALQWPRDLEENTRILQQHIYEAYVYAWSWFSQEIVW